MECQRWGKNFTMTLEGNLTKNHDYIEFYNHFQEIWFYDLNQLTILGIYAKRVTFE